MTGAVITAPATVTCPTFQVAPSGPVTVIGFSGSPTGSANVSWIRVCV